MIKERASWWLAGILLVYVRSFIRNEVMVLQASPVYGVWISSPVQQMIVSIRGSKITVVYFEFFEYSVITTVLVATDLLVGEETVREICSIRKSHLYCTTMENRSNLALSDKR